jgi:hypothetical protein
MVAISKGWFGSLMNSRTENNEFKRICVVEEQKHHSRGDLGDPTA